MICYTQLLIKKTSVYCFNQKQTGLYKKSYAINLSFIVQTQEIAT